MYIRAERGEQRPRCDGGKVEWSASGMERRGSAYIYTPTDTTEGKGGLPPEREPQRGIMRKKTGKSHINHYPDSRSNIKCRAWNMKKEISTA